MNPSNVIHLEGRIHGSTWQRWKPSGAGEVRFCVAVPGAAGAAEDVFCCAIAAMNSAAVAQLESQLSEGRMISLDGTARGCERVTTRDETLTLIVVESFELDRPTNHSTYPRRHHAHGKAAAAADDVQTFELASA